MIDNTINIEVYESGTTPIIDTRNELKKARGIRFTTGYGGGLYLDAAAYVPRDVVQQWQVNGGKRLVMRNGAVIVYEGTVDDLESALMAGDEGINITSIGQWGNIMMRRLLNKRWADTRIGADIIVYDESQAAADKCLLDRNNRLMFVPKAEAWANGQRASAKYTMPTGETVKRFTFNYELQEGAQSWEMGVYDDFGGGTTLWSAGASGSGSTDVTLGTPRQDIDFYFDSKAAQTPTSDGSIYGKFTNIVIYSETGTISIEEIAKDVIGGFSVLSSEDGNVGSNSYSLVPFITSDYEYLADILIRAASYGDSSSNAWTVGLLSSEEAAAPDGKPVIFVEQVPGLTDYEYAIRLEDDNLIAPFKLERDYSQIYNWIVVGYKNDLGANVYTTPDDDSNLKDTDSIDELGQRDFTIDFSTTDSAAAINAGKNLLAQKKDPRLVLTGPIKVSNYIRDKDNIKIPACRVRAGKRIKIENYAGEDVIFLISLTEFNGDSGVVTINAGDAGDFKAPLISSGLNLGDTDGFTLPGGRFLPV